MSDDEDIVVLKVCNGHKCVTTYGLEIEEETGELYCESCRQRFAIALKDGFRHILTSDDVQVVTLIFKRFDSYDKGYWTFEDFNAFEEKVGRQEPALIETPLGLREYFESEYDIQLHSNDRGDFFITCSQLQDMYGGYIFNGVNLLQDDIDKLETDGVVNTEVLE